MVRRQAFDATPRLRSVQHGMLVQDTDEGAPEERKVCSASPTEHEAQAIELAWKVCKHVVERHRLCERRAGRRDRRGR